MRRRCHNCGKVGHLVRNCWATSGDAERGTEDDPGSGAPFPGIDGAGTRNPSRANELRERVLPDGTDVKLCGLCRKWGDHYRARHPPDNAAVANDDAANVATEVMDEDEEPTSGAFARSRATRLI